MRELPVHILHQVLTYDPETGSLRWNVRSRDLFLHCKNPDRACAIWNAKYAGQEAGTDFDGYVAISFKTFGVGQIFAHRIAWAMHYGVWPEILDHDNRDRKANWIANLKEVSRQKNQQNLPLMSHNTSGIAGVSWDRRRGRWRAYIGSGRRQVNLGRFPCIGSAVKARNEALKNYDFHQNHGRNK